MTYSENQEREHRHHPDSFTSDLPPISAANGVIDFISSDGTVPQDQMNDIITSDTITFDMIDEDDNQYATTMTITAPYGPASNSQECQRHLRRCTTNLTQDYADWGNYFNCLREAAASSDCDAN